MRRWIAPMALAVMPACNSESSPPPNAQPVTLSFDGADARDATATRAHGERLTWVLGCRGCHGKDLRGQLWDDNPKEYGVTWSPNLTRSAQAMSAQQLRDVITRGIHPRRPQLYVMPSELFQHLANGDRDAVIAYLKSMPPAGEPSPDPQLGPRALKEIADGTAKPAATLVRELKDELPDDVGAQYGLGRYVTSVTCTECHGHRLEGHESEEGTTPDLSIAAAYSRDEFRALTTYGIAKDGRKIDDLMVSVGKNRLSRLTPRERDALYDYLVARAARPQ